MVINYQENYNIIINETQQKLFEIVKNIKIATISEEQMEKLKNSYAKWGEYGWTFPQFAKGSLFNNPPEDIKSANRKLDCLCTDEKMQGVFEDLKKLKVKQSDLSEAIDCYNKKYYKACVMILFAMIDSRLIRSQMKTNNNYKIFKDIRSKIKEGGMYRDDKERTRFVRGFNK